MQRVTWPSWLRLKSGSPGTAARSSLWTAVSGDAVFRSVAFICAIAIVAFIVAMAVYLTGVAWPAIQEFGAGFVSGQSWNPVTDKFGALPAIFGTLVTSLIAMILAIPISVGAAIFLAEVAPDWVKAPMSFLVEMLAAIPSVVLGLWGLFVMVPFLKPIELWTRDTFPWVPLFQGPIFGLSILAAGLILALMAIPYITAVTRDALTTVPSAQREAMLALGATKWETISRVVLPYARSGLIAGTLLGLGRVLGETMAVLLVIGNGNKLTSHIFSPGNTIASKIASEFNEASGDIWIGALVELALILFVITLIVNVTGRVLVHWLLGRSHVGSRA